MNQDSKAQAKLRKQVEEILNCPVSDRAWSFAVKERMVSEVIKGESEPAWLAGKLRELMEIGNARPERVREFVTPQRRQRRGKTVEGRREAISEALAEIARKSADVQAFRNRFLNDRLLQFGEVEGWIKEHWVENTYPHALVVRLKTGFKLQFKDGWHVEPPLVSVGPDVIEGLAPHDLVSYARQDSDWVRRYPIARDGTLRVLYDLSNTLADRFRWQAAQATMFIFTDITPLLSFESFQIGPPPFAGLPWGTSAHLACLTTITLIVDPMMTPTELSKQYAKVRAKLLVRKPRMQSPKHLKLGIFAVKHPALDRDAKAEWERLFPRWKYPTVSRFAKEARMATERLLLCHPADWRKAFAGKV